MNTNELTADYICKDDDRLQMALHVYKAMSTVRKHLIKEIFQAVGERLAGEIHGVKLVDEREESVYFWTEETDDFYVFGEVWYGQKGAIWLFAGICLDENSTIKEKTREHFVANADLKTWSDGRVSENHYIGAYVNQRCGGGGWHWEDFLSRAILNRDDVVSDVAGLLVRIYKGVFPLVSN